MAKASDNRKKRNKPRGSRLARVRRRQQNTSVFFLLWTTLVALSLGVMLVFSFVQQSAFVQSYKEEAAKEISEKGKEIQELLRFGPPSGFENDYNDYVHFLNRTYGVEILILDESGYLLFPKEGAQSSTPTHAEEVTLLRGQLEKQAGENVLFEGKGEYVYGAQISVRGNLNYLRVGRSLSLMQTSLSRMRMRTVLIGAFIFLSTFALSSAIAGWLVSPVTELTKKARKLAQGDFDVDFHGKDYGRELVELADSLNFARDELSKSDRMQKELIANVSHDFKTPLTMIKGYASMIMEISGDNPEKRNKHAQIIIDETDRLTSLVSDVLDLSKIHAGIAQLQVERVDMSAYLYEILSRFSELKDRQGYRFFTDVEEGLFTYADRLKIGQVLYNLIGNAVNYTGANQEVYLSLKKEGEVFRFAVTDTGKGIAKEELAGIWERYYRSADAHKRPVKGTGLGLSIVKTVLEKHDFTFGVDSEVGKGSTFYVVFPLAEREGREKKS